jgi:hypothetical protein
MDNPRSSLKDFITASLFAGVFVAVGGLIVAISLDVIHVPATDFHAPRLVVAAAGAAFFFAGLLVILQAGVRWAGEESPMAAWLQYIVLLALFISFASVFLWIGFSTMVDLVGRIVFILIGGLTFLGAAAFAFYQLPTRKRSHEQPGEGPKP